MALFARDAGTPRVSGVPADRFAPRRIVVAADLLRIAARSVPAILLLAGPAPFAAVRGGWADENFSALDPLKAEP